MKKLTPEKVQEVLLKLRKGATAAINAKQLEEVCPLFGWKAERGTFDGPVQYFDVDIFVGMVIGYNKNDHDRDIFVTTGRNHGELHIIPLANATPDTLANEAAKLKALVGIRHGNGITIASVDGPMTLKSHDGTDETGLLVKYTFRAAGIKLTAKDGAEFIEVKSPRYKGLTLWDVFRWANKQGLVQDVSALLGMPDPEIERRDREYYGVRYDITHSGLCPVCFNHQKLNDDDGMVLHGYRRPGDGEIHGECFGVKYPPIETSCEGSKQYLSVALRPHLEALQKALVRFQGSEMESLSERVTEGYGRNKTVKFIDHKRGTEKYEELRLLEIKSLERSIKDTEETIAMFERVVDLWEPDFTPEERREKKLRPKVEKALFG